MTLPKLPCFTPLSTVAAVPFVDAADTKRRRSSRVAVPPVWWIGSATVASEGAEPSEGGALSEGTRENDERIDELKDGGLFEGPGSSAVASDEPETVL